MRVEDRSLIALAKRAEDTARRTGRPTCLICRYMIVQDADTASCDMSFHGGTICSGMLHHLQAMTRRAEKCNMFDSMLD